MCFKFNKMPLNVEKCCSVAHTHCINKIAYKNQINQNELVHKESCKDLRLTFQTNFKFNMHYSQIVELLKP